MDDGLRRYRSVLADNARWDGFEFRADDIVISTPGKCGTTWMQMICALLVFGDPKLPRRLTELSPWLDMQTDSADNVFASLADQEHRRFIKSHTPLDGLPYDERVTYITVGRDPRDVAISSDNHGANINFDAFFRAREAAVGLEDVAELMPDGPPVRIEDPLERFWYWIEHDAPPGQNLSGLAKLFHHLRTFWDRRDAGNVVLFHYTDLQDDLDREMRRMASVLGIEVDAERWPTLVAAATFDQMRHRADELAPEVRVDGFWNDNRRFFHSGINGQWQSFFGPGDQERYRARALQLAPPALAAWVHAGWRGRPR